jgi:hypothetical protein
MRGSGNPRQFLAVGLALATVLSVAVGPVGIAAATVGPNDAGTTVPAVQTAATNALYRANAGGAFTEADGTAWDALADYKVAGQEETSNHGQPSAIHSSVPSGTPTQIWETERWDPSESPEMQYEFDVPSGQQVEVRLYFYDGYTGTSSVGDRVFDVSIEGATVLDDFDIIDTYGDDTGAMESFTVTSDGTIDVDFGHVTENPQINAIEIVSAEPQPDTLGGPGSVGFGSVLVDNTETQTVTVTNLGGTGDPSIDISGVSIAGTDASEFSAGSASQTTLAPGESADVPVTFTPSSVDPKSATLQISHAGSNSPLTVDLAGEGASATDPDFGKSKLQGFSAGNPTALEWGPDDRLYVSTQGGTVYALAVERTGENSYQVTNEVQIDAIKDIPNHDDTGDYNPGENDRQITGLATGGTASEPIVYVSSSDPSIDVGQDDDDTDTNSGAISKLTISPGTDGTLQASEVAHEVMVLGLPRSEENHATNGLDLSADGDTLYVAQGGHTNKGAPGDNFGHTPEYALSAAVLEIDLAQIENNYNAKSLQSYDTQGSSQSYPDLPFLYAIPTIQTDDGTDGDDLPFGGNDGINQAKLIEGGPVQIYSPGYRNPYDLVVTEGGQVYVSDHGPNTGWGGQPADASGNIVADASSVTNHPNEGGSQGTNDQLAGPVQEGEYGGHAAPIRANPTGADIYDADGNVIFDITSSNSPVPSSMVNPVEADYIPPTSQSTDPGAPAGSANTMETTSGQKVLFGPTGATDEYTASNFGGAMEGDILQVELGGDIVRVELNAAGDAATNVETIFNTGGPLGIDAVGDDEKFAGTVWTANHGGNDVTVFEPVDYEGPVDDTCTGADDASIDEDGDGYDNADEIDAGTNPCSASSTPADFDDDGTSNLNDPDDDDDGQPDTSDPFAVDPDDGTTTTLPVQHDLSELSLFGDDGQGWTGLMTNGQDDYQSLYDPTKMTVGGAAEVLTVEEVPPGDAYQTQNDQQYAFQFGVNPPDEAFVVESTVASFPDTPEDFQSAGIYVGTGDQSNYAKLVVAADGSNGGIEFAQEEGDSFTHQTSPNVVGDSAVTGSDTTLRLIVDPTTDPNPGNSETEVAVTAEYEVGGTTSTVGTAAIPASWLDTADGSGLAVGVIATSNGASSTFPATWTDISVTQVSDAGEVTVAEAVASQNAPEDQIGLQEIQEAVNWWATGTAVPGTGGETIGLSQMKNLVNMWGTGATVGDDDPTGTTSADVTVNSGTSNIDASTFNGGSFEVTNTGDEPISSVEIDLSESAIPDAVFDPQGSAGDAGSKGLVIDSEVGGDGSVGVVSTADADVFSQPRNGMNADDGYEVLTIGFDDFDPGETVAFSVDIDPTTIKNVDTTGGEGSVSGLELSGSAVTVSSSSATVSNDLFTDGSQGGSQSSVTGDVPAAPTLGVDGDTLQSTDFPAHQAATVSSASQTLTLSGPAGATVELLTVEASAPPSDGYDVDAFEADNAEAVSTQTVTLDSNGQATVSVSLSESNLNYFQAAVQDGSGATGAVSQTVVLDVQTSTNTAPTNDAISDQAVVTGETVTVPVTASDAEGDSLTLSKSSGPSFVTLTDNGDGTGSLEIAPASGDAGTDGPLVSLTDGNTDSGTFCGGDDVTPGSSVPSSTPGGVYDCEVYGTMTRAFDVTSGSEVEVRLYLSNQFSGANTDGDRQFNVDVEGGQVLSQYDPVQDVGHATGTVKTFTVTENGDGTVTITFDPGAAENPQVNAIEIVETSSGGSS